MKLETKISEKDILLLKRVVPLLIIVLLFFMVLKPRYESITAGLAEKENLEYTLDEKSFMVDQLPLNKKIIEDCNNKLNEGYEKYYDVLSNQEIDDIFTSLSYKFSLQVLNFTVDIDDSVMSMHGYLVNDSLSYNSILSKSVTLQVEGKRDNIQALIDYIYEDSGIFVKSYSINDSDEGTSGSISMSVLMSDWEALNG
ncbi:MAG: hypothetical protein SO412_07915 [Erysipelotrichaceae bacterium]|nr:hypothetical protein [Erysipelotrichaceae bacterium]